MGRTKQSSSFWYSRSRSSSAPTTPREADPPVGCMSMVHYLIFAPGAGCVGHPPTSSHSHAVVAPHHDANTGNMSRGGLEAPRNSLDLDADNLKDIQIGVQIEPVFDALATSKMRPKATAPSSEAETPRTPSLLARLMGIDGLPDNQSPSPALKKPRPTAGSSQRPAKKDKDKGNCSAPSAGKEKKKHVIPESMNREPLRSLSCNVPAGEARSLPDTPRASTSARASWDGPRLSLQALKENILDRAAQYMSLPTSPTSSSAGKKKKDAHGRREERERIAKEHAREIVRQSKETIASRKSKKNAAKSSPAAANKENVSPTPAMEDKLVAIVQAGKRTVASPARARSTEQPPTHSPRVPLAPKQPPLPPPPQRAKPSRPPPPPPPLDPPRARKPDGCERFATRIKNPAASPAAPSASPSAPTRSTDFSVAGRGIASSPSTVPLKEDPEYSYLRTVLERGGFMRAPPGRPFKGHSVSAPVDPIVFHLLELELPVDEARLGTLRHRWNRKLLFHLTQEILADILLGLDAWSSGTAPPSGAPLLGKVWNKVRSFPAADCRVVGDIDALVASDLEAASVRLLGRHPAVEESGDVADELAERVLQELLGECVAESVSLSSRCCWWWSSRAGRWE
ncbi:uncharacterized protein LOC133888543 [Phragmites australis]|uniref:uncharacterized protein LOC133888543 n=1 Tax=Phragmites australis TaxID=29695 RepID=UPI002D798A2C|nr:uncharacterized protein LOC133888543 [Phragmites australis]